MRKKAQKKIRALMREIDVHSGTAYYKGLYRKAKQAYHDITHVNKGKVNAK
jgi:hypothetical protein